MNFQNLQNYDLLTKVFLVSTEFGGRSGPVLDQYRGQFFWHINGESCADWDAIYYFKNGKVQPGDSALCKIILSENVKKYSNGSFPVGRQFAIREGAKVVALGIIEESKVKSA
jgi:translation elongation factor EF-Tu-like GTPase